MIGKGFPNSPRRLTRWLSSALLAAAGWWASTGQAQTEVDLQAAASRTVVGSTGTSSVLSSSGGASSSIAPASGIAPALLPDAVQKGSSAKGSEAITDPNVQQAGCATCGGGILGGPASSESLGCCCGGPCCVPGRLHCCSPCCSDTTTGRMLCGIYNCICCPDPCYEPHWVAAANAAFFVDSARPVTQMALKYDGMNDIQHPDRAEYLIPRPMASMNKAVGCLRGGTGKGGNYIANSADIESLSLYTEGAIDRVGVFVEMPYRDYDPGDILSDPNATACSRAGFGDMTIGTKTLLLDCELLQVASQFKTFVPVGNFLQNLGTGHVSLEPAVLFTLKLTPDAYLQGESAYWIPIGGDPLYEGNIFHNHFSYNQVIYRILPDVQLIGTAELNEWSVMGGNYTAFPIAKTDNGNAFIVSGTSTMVSVGPGIRLNICDKIDFGVGSAFAITGPRWAREEVKAEFRWRF